MSVLKALFDPEFWKRDIARHAGYVGAQQVPGADIADFGGKLPSPEGGFYPSAAQNVRQGRYGDAAMQTIGAAGDIASAIPAIGPAIGMVAGAPRTLSRALRGTARRMSTLQVNYDPDMRMNFWRKPILQDGNEVGAIEGVHRGGDMWQINTAEVHKDFQSKGLGMRAYEELARDVHAKGGYLASDTSVSEQAAQVYAGFERRGYEVVKNPTAELVDDFDDKGKPIRKWLSGNGAPVWTVYPKPK